MSILDYAAAPADPVPQTFWTPIPYHAPKMDGQWGVWSNAVDQRHSKSSPEVYTDPTYTATQILREKSVLLRARQANNQRGTPTIHMEAFYTLHEDS